MYYSYVPTSRRRSPLTKPPLSRRVRDEESCTRALGRLGLEKRGRKLAAIAADKWDSEAIAGELSMLSLESGGADPLPTMTTTKSHVGQAYPQTPVHQTSHPRPQEEPSMPPAPRKPTPKAIAQYVDGTKYFHTFIDGIDVNSSSTEFHRIVKLEKYGGLITALHMFRHLMEQEETNETADVLGSEPQIYP